MTAKALLKTSEMHRMATIAKEFGITVETVVEGRTFRFSPFPSAGCEARALDDFEEIRL